MRAEGRDATMLPTPVRALVRLLLLMARSGDAAAVGELEGHVGAFRDPKIDGSRSERWRDMELQALAALHYLGREASPGSVAGAVEILCKVCYVRGPKVRRKRGPAAIDGENWVRKV